MKKPTLNKNTKHKSLELKLARLRELTGQELDVVVGGAERCVAASNPN